jgi:Uma2 family endonuclease
MLLHGLTWQDYLEIGRILRDRPALRLTFDQGTLEIMTTSQEHEKYKSWLGRLIEILAEEARLRIEPGGNMTFQSEDLEKGLEGDNCWWIEHEEQVRGKLVWDSNVDPPPDLVLEIEVSRAAVARMPIYAALKVPEVWCFDGRSLRVYVNDSVGSYRLLDGSPIFPGIPIADLVPFAIPRKDKDYLSVIREFRTWVRAQLRKTGKKKSR